MIYKAFDFYKKHKKLKKANTILKFRKEKNLKIVLC